MIYFWHSDFCFTKSQILNLQPQIPFNLQFLKREQVFFPVLVPIYYWFLCIYSFSSLHTHTHTYNALYLAKGPIWWSFIKATYWLWAGFTWSSPLNVPCELRSCLFAQKMATQIITIPLNIVVARDDATAGLPLETSAISKDKSSN